MEQQRTQAVAMTMSDGSLVVLRFFIDVVLLIDGEWKMVEREPTPEAVQAEIDRVPWQTAEGVKITCVSRRLIEESDVPTDRAFRNSWKDTGTSIECDMPKAREIHRARLRRKRTPLLAVLDSDYLRADEDGDNQKKRDVAARKQALRDVTDDPRIESATTPEELKAVIPDVLSP